MNECDFVVDVWDVNTASPVFGQQMAKFRHSYRVMQSTDGGPYDNFRVRLNQSATQVHFYWISSFWPDGTVRLDDEVSAFDPSPAPRR